MLFADDVQRWANAANVGSFVRHSVGHPEARTHVLHEPPVPPVVAVYNISDIHSSFSCASSMTPRPSQVSHKRITVSM